MSHSLSIHCCWCWNPGSSPSRDTGSGWWGLRGGADAADSDSWDDDIPLTQRSKVLAKKWVEKNKVNTELDKDADAYVARVLQKLSGGENDRRVLRSKKKVSDSPELDPVLVAAEARIYYSRERNVRAKSPKKILDHRKYPSLGMYYLCLWSDVGYADQDIEEWKPADYALQFEGLVEDYRKV